MCNCLYGKTFWKSNKDFVLALEKKLIFFEIIRDAHKNVVFITSMARIFVCVDHKFVFFCENDSWKKIMMSELSDQW